MELTKKLLQVLPTAIFALIASLVVKHTDPEPIIIVFWVIAVLVVAIGNVAFWDWLKQRKLRRSQYPPQR